ncbi:hypothetical protein Nepgr_031863 [Nepenthes gracilis]|uniref:Uncharacterized protein n=1 Tax=Nepenthes gracilis TaxID=150966 RepID=A0AAD3THI6_NEPGR|nr:hypothetical protein Nepgr_031863 [Nepenthes gracilis]
MFARTVSSSIYFPDAGRIGTSNPLFCSPAGFPISKLGGASLLSSRSLLKFAQRRRGDGAVVSALEESGSMMPVTGIVFQPFEEVKNDSFVVPMAPRVSLARQRYSADCEAAINEQIK